ncbi:Ku protein [Paenibacillus sp. sptzw28]|uniref:non-homologous end joining protein Ku n=1 Tax=Paenibacillus sp. sptzw28 TaxID=715179 RepID=UPI001C6E897C|nr:Ku protein [Paenibacillus sp. sptzw28]QYR19107.1 Ku protein [Paenibacillus sp. sptzw28]
MQTIWKGAVSFGLVNVPVKMFTATQDNDIPMKMLHKDFHVPIRYHRTCPKCGDDVSWNDIVKGYEYEPGHYVTFEKEELEKLSAENSREIRILDFIELDEIDPVYYHKTYYLAPEETGKHAYTLLVEALKATNKIGVANATIRSKSSLAAIRVIDNVLSMVTMFYADEIRSIEQVPNLPKSSMVDERELDMAKLLIEQLTSEFKPDQYKDDYRERLLAAIEDKVEGKEVKFAPEEKPANFIDLMEALKASLQQPKSAASKADTGSVTNGNRRANARHPRRKQVQRRRKIVRMPAIIMPRALPGAETMRSVPLKLKPKRKLASRNAHEERGLDE